MAQRRWRETNALNTARLDEAFKLIDQAVEEGMIPGGTAAVTHQGRTAGIYSAGYSVHYGNVKVNACKETIYDCASLTKVTVTLPLILTCIEKGLADLSEPVASFLPEFAVQGKENITLKQLLCHTSGLPDHIKLYEMELGEGGAVEYICRLPLTYPPDTKVIYSDLGYILLGKICEILLKQPLEQAADRFVFQPLGMVRSAYNPPGDWKPLTAATEYSDLLGRHKQGEVHDENAYALGGICGHAGLFSTAEDLLRYASAWLANGRHRDGRWLSPVTVDAAVQSHTSGLNGNRGIGWVLRGDAQDIAGDLFSTASFGHTGFTGVSLWMDPLNQLGVVLLTNRVHYGRQQSVTRLRARFHNAVAASLE